MDVWESNYRARFCRLLMNAGVEECQDNKSYNYLRHVLLPRNAVNAQVVVYLFLVRAVSFGEARWVIICNIQD